MEQVCRERSISQPKYCVWKYGSRAVTPVSRRDSMILRGRLCLCRGILEAVVVEPPMSVAQHLCLDAAFVGPGCDATARVFGYEPHVRPVSEERAAAKARGAGKRHKPRRCVVERTIGWLDCCRGILVRYKKKAENYLRLVRLACARLWYRRLHRLTPYDSFLVPVALGYV